MKAKLIAALALVALVLAVLPARAADEPKTIAGVIAGSKDHTILWKAINDAALVDTLKGKGELTVFAPTDAAFKRLGEETAKKIVGDRDMLKTILTAHAVKGKLLSADVVKLDGKEIETLQGTKFKITLEGKIVLIGGAKILRHDVKASNGVVHVIDTVLLPGK